MQPAVLSISVCLLTSLAVGCRPHAGSPAASSIPTAQALPVTTVGTRLRALLDAYNANDSLALARLVHEHYGQRLRDNQAAPGAIVLRWLETYANYGPLAVDSVTVSSEHSLRGWLRGTITKAWMEILVATDSAVPYRLTRVTTGRGLTPPYRRRAIAPASAPRELGAYLDQLAAAGYFSGVAILARNGTPVLERSYGLADVQSRRPNTPDTRFNLASVGKVFTAMAVAQLARQGKLALSDTISRFVPELPLQVRGGVTVGQLLTHTSGLGELGPRFDTISFPRARDYLPHFTDTTLAFAPGTSFQYSNRGYIVLGAIVEAVTGESYEAYLGRAIFAPLGMARTGLVDPVALSAGEARGYTRYPSVRGGFGSGPRRDNTALLTRGSPAGGAYSSARDLLRFAEAVRLNTFGGAAPADSVFGVTSAGQYGFAIGADRRAFGHGGGHPGVSANVQVLPGDGWSLVVLSNYDTITNHVAAYALELLRRP